MPTKILNFVNLYLKFSATLFIIRLGSNSLSSNDANVKRLSTDIYYLHPDFNRTTMENDVGVIEFRMAVTYSGKTIHI